MSLFLLSHVTNNEINASPLAPLSGRIPYTTQPTFFFFFLRDFIFKKTGDAIRKKKLCFFFRKKNFFFHITTANLDSLPVSEHPDDASHAPHGEGLLVPEQEGAAGPFAGLLEAPVNVLHEHV